VDPKQRGHDAEFEPGVAAAIAMHFGGDAALYQAFAATCAAQFALDAVAGQLACEVGDLSGLRRLSHNLKSALIVLGHDDVSELAARVEEQATVGDLRSACASWRSLHAAMLLLKTP
jgi:HPt (histidine-containing phosphotransfer) domain-containing protein